MTFFTPAVLLPAVVKLKRSETLHLRYRIHVHAGRWSAPQLTASLEGQ